MTDTLDALLRDGFQALTRGDTVTAADRCRRAIGLDPQCIQAHFLVGLVATERRDSRTAASAFGSVTRLDPNHAAAWAQLARVFVQAGQPGRAEQALRRATALDSTDPVVLDVLGGVHSLLGDQPAALVCYARAAAARPDHVPFLINVANAHMFLGATGAAQRTLERALALAPDDAQAHWLLATLRTAPDHTHVDRLEQLIARARAPQSLAFLCYAAGKAYEDLEQWDAAFAAFARGAAARRSVIEFDEVAEQATFDALTEHLHTHWLRRTGVGAPDPGPVFVVGQPRTGSTLVERIITSHSAVHSAGELQQFRLSIRRLTAIAGRERLSPAIVAAAANLDPRQLGEAYLHAVRTLRGSTPRFVDKLPNNFLFLPLIAKALPNASIVHVTRAPMDACFASFKQLFADAYAHSYDQQEMARHFLRYHRLMEAWRACLGNRLIEVSYEALVSDVEPQTRRLVHALGLPWEDACLAFHRQDGAVSTASAVQVRTPAHTRSVGRWRRYETHLGPMRAALAAGGLPV